MWNSVLENNLCEDFWKGKKGVEAVGNEEEGRNEVTEVLGAVLQAL